MTEDMGEIEARMDTPRHLDLDAPPPLKRDHMIINGETCELTAYWDFDRPGLERMADLRTNLDAYAQRIALDGEEALAADDVSNLWADRNELLMMMFREPDEEIIQGLAPWQADRLAVYYSEGFELGRQAFQKWNQEQAAGIPAAG